jgi:hypothetical protein
MNTCVRLAKNMVAASQAAPSARWCRNRSEIRAQGGPSRAPAQKASSPESTFALIEFGASLRSAAAPADPRSSRCSQSRRSRPQVKKGYSSRYQHGFEITGAIALTASGLYILNAYYFWTTSLAI